MTLGCNRWNNVISLKIKFQIVSQIYFVFMYFDPTNSDVTFNTGIYYQYHPHI
jgi:hypothetical protein